MIEGLKLPVGIEDFQEIRKAGFYYVDKTQLIEQLLEGWGKVNLFTRPRRFGKTLNMSMLRYFFEIGADETLFDRLNGQPEAKPQSYWINTSGNDLVKRFIDKANKTTRDEIERLISGQPIEKFIRQELTYDEIDNSIDNLWSVLFTTGYLTQVGITEQGSYKLVIPNKEIREVYKLQIQEWFKNTVLSNTEQLISFWNAIQTGKAEVIETYLNRILSNSISVFDTKARNEEKESSYHTRLIGLLAGNSNWLVKSNIEAGDGFADIIIETEDPDAGIVIELKYSKEFSGLDTACEKVIAQIHDRKYENYLKNDGRYNILLYGMAFYKKRCRIVVES